MEGGPLLRTGMPVSGFWNAASWHLSPRIYRVVPDQKQSVGVEEPISYPNGSPEQVHIGVGGCIGPIGVPGLIGVKREPFADPA